MQKIPTPKIGEGGKSGRYHMVRVAPEACCADVYTYHSSAALWMALMVLTALVVGLGVDESTASCIGASLLLISVNATTPGPNCDLLCDPDENDCSKSSRATWTVLPPKNAQNLSHSLKVNEILRFDSQ